MQFDVFIVGNHPLGEAVNNKYLRWQIIVFHQLGKVLRAVVNFHSIKGTNFCTRFGSCFHRKLGVNAQVNIRKFQVFLQQWQFILNFAQRHLDVEKNQCIFWPHSRNGKNRINLFLRHTETIFAVFTGIALRHHGYVMKCRNDRSCRVGRFPGFNFFIQFCPHFCGSVFAQRTHSFGVQITVKSHDAGMGEYSACQRIGLIFYGPLAGSVTIGQRY